MNGLLGPTGTVVWAEVRATTSKFQTPTAELVETRPTNLPYKFSHHTPSSELLSNHYYLFETLDIEGHGVAVDVASRQQRRHVVATVSRDPQTAHSSKFGRGIQGRRLGASHLLL